MLLQCNFKPIPWPLQPHPATWPFSVYSLDSLDYLPIILTFMGFLGGTSGKEPTCQWRRCKRREFNPWVDPEFDPWIPAWQGGHGNPLQYSCLENPVDRGAWRAMVHRVINSWTWLKGLIMPSLSFLTWSSSFSHARHIILYPANGPNSWSRGAVLWCLVGAVASSLLGKDFEQ